MKYTDRQRLMLTVLTILKEDAATDKTAQVEAMLSQTKKLRKNSDTMELFDHARLAVRNNFNDKEQEFYRSYRSNFNAVFDQMISYIQSLPSEQSEPCLKLIQGMNERFRHAGSYMPNEFDTALSTFKKEFFKVVEPNVRNYAMGAMAGFFKKLGLPENVGLESSRFIDRQDAAKLSLVSHDIAEQAKSYRR